MSVTRDSTYDECSAPPIGTRLIVASIVIILQKSFLVAAQLIMIAGGSLLTWSTPRIYRLNLEAR